ncbi:MAG: prepilin-type N-terminal cleavage/methylation domain-containing protein [Gammaproteobacteria bacterium]|nr:prepilin-type N-terminal cleavage/methylation domain-containing protein [Gammaproteobacteria bacterium]
MKAQMQKGFTLIELMIVVAIIGILAAVALPAYQDYTIRAKISECAGVVAACKTSVSEYYASENALPTNSAAAGCATTTTQYCGAPSVANGIITVATDASVGIASCNLVLTPTATANGWSGSTTCNTKYVPANFR